MSSTIPNKVNTSKQTNRQVKQKYHIVMVVILFILNLIIQVQIIKYVKYIHILIYKSAQKDLSPSYLNKRPFQIIYQHKHTTPISNNNLKKISFNNNNNNGNNNSNKQTKSHVVISAVPLSQMHRTIDTNMVGYQSRLLITNANNGSSRIVERNSFNQHLKQYCKIKDQMKRQNHSPRMEYQGSSIINQKIGGQFKDQVIKGLLENSHKNNKSKSKSNTKLFHSPTLTSNSNTNTIESGKQKQKQIAINNILKNQLLKQRQIFLRFNMNLRPQQNQRQQKQQRQRKTNLKILENLFINKNDRQTNMVYE